MRTPRRGRMRFAKCFWLFFKAWLSVDFKAVNLAKMLSFGKLPWVGLARHFWSSFPQMERALDYTECRISWTSFLSPFETRSLTLGKYQSKSGFQSFHLYICFSLLIISRKIVPGVLCSFLAFWPFSEFSKIWCCLSDWYVWRSLLKWHW